MIFDRGRVTVPRGFLTREEAIAYSVLNMAADRVEVVEALDAAEAEILAQRKGAGR